MEVLTVPLNKYMASREMDPNGSNAGFLRVDPMWGGNEGLPSGKHTNSY